MARIRRDSPQYWAWSLTLFAGMALTLAVGAVMLSVMWMADLPRAWGWPVAGFGIAAILGGAGVVYAAWPRDRGDLSTRGPLAGTAGAILLVIGIALCGLAIRTL